jgi:CheY-like chemotaxis protein
MHASLRADYSKMEAGALPLEEAPVIVPDVLEQTVSLMRPKAEAKAQTLVTSIAPDARAIGPVITDAMRIRQVINNLLSNAIKFTPANGSITVGLACEPRGPGRARLRMTVTDTGMGIDKSMFGRLFKPFSQVAVGHSRMDGTGLGLAICKRIVDAMGGQIGVESEGAGRGSTFWFTVELRTQRVLPALSLVRGEELASSEATAPGTPPDYRSVPVPAQLKSARTAVPLDKIDTSVLRGRRMLLAEDNAVNAMLLKRQLSSVEVDLVRRTALQRARTCLTPPHQVHVVDGGLAVAQWCKEKFDCILMDIQMPVRSPSALPRLKRTARRRQVMDGLEAATVIRNLEQREGRRRTPIVALSAGVQPEEVQACHNAGMSDFVPKPVSRALLYQALVNAVREADPSSPMRDVSPES